MWKNKAVENCKLVDSSEIMTYTFQDFQLLSGLSTDVRDVTVEIQLIVNVYAQ